MGNYFVFHLHSMLSNPSTNIDSVTNFKSYISEAKRLGMKGLCFSEHGNIFEFCHKKEEIEAAGMKYVHGMEAYITDTLERGKRRAFHCILIARNYEGFLEINRLFTKSYNRNDGHFFYNPRITFDELEQTSDNIIVTSACLGGPLGKGEKEVQDRFLRFLVNNKNRSFLEIQHHNVAQQITYNQKLAQLSRDTGIKLIAGTDTHALNEEHMIGRKQLQISKGVNFPDEDEWDLVFKSYDELLSAYELQDSLPYDVYMEAIQNTNVLLEMCDSYALDTSKKYPKIYKDSVATFKQKINEGFEHNKYVKQHPKKEVIKRIREEEQVYEKVEAVDFMLLMCYLKEWQIKNGIYTGPGRGSVSGSEIAYVLGITEMDSIKFDLNFFRFLNPSRVTNSDIDLDFGDKDREKMKKFLLDDHMGLPNIQTAEIITFNTIKMKGAIKDIGRALQMPLREVQDISNAVETDENQKQYIDEKWRKKYPELFKYVDIVNGVITSIGTHPSGVLISDRDISSLIGLCSLSTTPYPVTALNMKELDALWFVKLDVLGLANVDLINQTCELAGIERLTPDNTDLDDMKVWESIREDTTGIFQWASDQASAFIKKFMSDKVIKIAKEHNPNFSMLKHFSFGNGLLRPACASFRDDVANGEFYTNGLKELDDFLATTFGHCIEENQYVSTTEGQKKIKDVQIGDRVYTFDGVHTVINKFENGVKILVNVKLVNGVEVRCTPNHMFLTMEGWKMALSLTEKDVAIFNGSPCHILSVTKCDCGNTYDLEVETAHNYIVNGIVVHNCSMQEDIMRFLVRFCGYSDGESDNVRRCVSGDTEIIMENGRVKKIKDMLVGDKVISVNENSWTLECSNVRNVFDNGVQDVYKVFAEHGVEVTATKEHKFMTLNGYKRLEDLSKNDCLLVPRRVVNIKPTNRPNERLSGDILFAIGCLIGDGSLTESPVALTNSDPSIIEHYEYCIKKEYQGVNKKEKIEFRAYKTPGVNVEWIYTVSVKNKFVNKRLFSLIKRLGLNVLSADKKIPEELFEYPCDDKLSNFLGGLFTTDGLYNLKGNYIGYCSISKQLCLGVSRLLLKYGIYSYILTKKVNGYDYSSYELVIRQSDSLEKFEKNILEFIVGYKKKKYKKIIELSKSNSKFDYLIKDIAQEEGRKFIESKQSSLRNIYGDIKIAKSITDKKARKMCEISYMPKTYRLLHSDFIPVRVKNIKKIGEEHVYDIEVDKNHNYIANGIWVHNCIAKKKGTEQLLPEIEQRFIEYSSQTYGITKEKCAEVIKPFLQVIQDASNYGFSWNHSDAYSCIGYICGYLRYYYPYEFIATALNVFQDKPEIFSTFVDYANRHGMKIAPPRFRKSQYTYIYNKEDQTIEKGLGSIKYINKDCADSLYAIRHMQFNSFTDLLYYVTENTSIDKRQLETLIKCNYFDEFGKNGKLIELLERFKEKYKKTHTDKTKMKRLEELREYERYIDDYRLPFCEQIETELDVLGYIAFRAPCNKRLFYVIDSNTKYTPILNIYSLSSGKTSRCKVEKKAYAKSKIKNGDILYVQEATKKPDYIKTETGFQKRGTFSTVLTKYRTITDEELDRILGRN